MKEYKKGTKVFLDFLHSKPEGTVTKVIEPGDGRGIQKGQIEIRITKAAGGYSWGEIIVVPAWKAVPMAQKKPRISGQFFLRIDTDYCYR